MTGRQLASDADEDIAVRRADNPVVPLVELELAVAVK
jgi:hypothetical protein